MMTFQRWLLEPKWPRMVKIMIMIMIMMMMTTTTTTRMMMMTVMMVMVMVVVVAVMVMVMGMMMTMTMMMMMMMMMTMVMMMVMVMVVVVVMMVVTTAMTMTMLLIMMMTTMRFHVACSLPHNSVLRPLHGLKSAPARRRFFHRATPPPIRQSPWWQGPRKADSVWGCTPPLRMGRWPPPSRRPLVASPGWKPPRSDAASCLEGSSGRWMLLPSPPC